MAINIENEQLITLTEASKMLPSIGGKHIHVSTLWRWCRIGRYGITLEYVCMGRRIMTTYAAIQRFFIALTQPKQSPAVSYRRKTKPRTTAQRQREMDEATAILVRAGIIPLTSREIVRA